MRWIAVALGIGVAAFALANGFWRAGATAPEPREAISDASHAALERVLRDAGAGEAGGK